MHLKRIELIISFLRVVRFRYMPREIFLKNSLDRCALGAYFTQSQLNKGFQHLFNSFSTGLSTSFFDLRA